MKTIANIIFVIILLSSCSSNKFLSRKYTTGFYNESHKSLKHNTIKSETDNSYASLNSTIELKKATSITEAQTEKEIINAKINSITKKDSIIHVKRKGKDARIIIKNNLPDVSVTIDENHQIVPEKLKVVDQANIKKRYENKIRKNANASLILAIIPLVGFVIALTALRMIRKYRTFYKSEDCDFYKDRSIVALCLSIIPTLLLVALVGLIIVALILF